MTDSGTNGISCWMRAMPAPPGARSGSAKPRRSSSPVRLAPYAEALPLHPHDAPLQWRLELGFPGLLLASAAIGLALWRLATTSAWPPWRRAAAFGYAASALLIALVSFGTWQSWWLSALWLGAALMASLGEPTRPVAT